MLNLPLCHWSSQLFHLRAQSSTDAPVLLLNPAYFLNDDFFRGIQNQDRYLKLSAWLSRNIFYITIIQQNIGVLSSECKCYLHRRLCIKCLNNSNSKLCVRRVTHCRFLQTRSSLWHDSDGKLSFASIFHRLSM